MKRTVCIPIILLLIAIFTQSQYQTTPTLRELKALRSIRGKILGTIIWSTARHGTSEIYKMNADGTRKVRLTNDKEDNSHPVWSKNGQWIYYQRNDDIYRMRSDGSNSQLVVKDGSYFDISADGLNLVYKKREEDRDSILLHNLEKGTTEEIVPARVPEFEGKGLGYPAISPDGNWLAFASDYPKTWTTHIVKLDGSNRYQFARGCMPQYRPDGLKLAWISGGDHKVFIASPDGKDRVPFVDHSTIPGRRHSYFPRWSNDAKYIVFAASPHFDWSSDYEIYIKPVNGGEAVRLTFNSGSDIWPDIFIPD